MVISRISLFLSEIPQWPLTIAFWRPRPLARRVGYGLAKSKLTSTSTKQVSPSPPPADNHTSNHVGVPKSVLFPSAWKEPCAAVQSRDRPHEASTRMQLPTRGTWWVDQ